MFASVAPHVLPHIIAPFGCGLPVSRVPLALYTWPRAADSLRCDCRRLVMRCPESARAWVGGARTVRRRNGTRVGSSREACGPVRSDLRRVSGDTPIDGPEALPSTSRRARHSGARHSSTFDRALRALHALDFFSPLRKLLVYGSPGGGQRLEAIRRSVVSRWLVKIAPTP